MSLNYHQRIFDFGDIRDNNVVIHYESTERKLILRGITSNQNGICVSKEITMNEWIHVTATFSNDKHTLFINGFEECSFTLKINKDYFIKFRFFRIEKIILLVKSVAF